MVSEKEIKETKKQIEKCNDRELLEKIQEELALVHQEIYNMGESTTNHLGKFLQKEFTNIQEDLALLRQEIWSIAEIMGVERKEDSISYIDFGSKSISRELWTIAKALGVELNGDVQGNIVSYSPPKNQFLERLEKEEAERRNEELTNKVNKLERERGNFVKKSRPDNIIRPVHTIEKRAKEKQEKEEKRLKIIRFNYARRRNK